MPRVLFAARAAAILSVLALPAAAQAQADAALVQKARAIHDRVIALAIDATGVRGFFQRADGHVVLMHQDAGDGQWLWESPGNAYSQVMVSKPVSEGSKVLALQNGGPLASVGGAEVEVRYAPGDGKLVSVWGAMPNSSSGDDGGWTG